MWTRPFRPSPVFGFSLRVSDARWCDRPAVGVKPDSYQTSAHRCPWILARASVRSSGSGSAAVRVWRPAWIVTVRYRRAVRTNFLMLQPVWCLDPVADGHRGEHDAQVCVDRFACAVVDRAGLQVVLGHPEGLLDAPEPVVGVDDEFGGLAGQVGGVALPARQGCGSWPPTRGSPLLVAPVSWMYRLRLTAAFPSTARSALATCSSMPRSVRRARSWRYW